MKISLLFLFLCLVASFVSISGQNQSDDKTRENLERIFTQPDTSFLDQYEIVSSTTQGTLEYLEKCAEGRNKGKNVCVPYYNCDADTNMVIIDGKSDGYGIIDVRFGSNSCDHYLDKCCDIPPEGLPDNYNATQPPPTLPPVTQSPPTKRPPVVTPPDQGGSTQTPVVTNPPIVNPPIQQKGCGIRNTQGIDFTITGNLRGEAEYGEFPWMVAILHKFNSPANDGKISICGGSLIAYNVVLTGAHCVNGLKTSDIKIRAGEWDTQTTKERIPYQERDVIDIAIHKDFNSKVLFNDFALLFLESPIIPAENVGTICLPNQDEIINSKNCFASGWGTKNFEAPGAYSVILKKIELPTVNFNKCQDDLRKTRLGQFFNLHHSFMCAGGIAGKDTCTGDGGSPLVCPDPKNRNRYVQAGIVAWGIGCGEDGVPGVYGDVAKFRIWIEEEFQKRNFDTSSYIV